jgi:hypothetical protein
MAGHQHVEDGRKRPDAPAIHRFSMSFSKKMDARVKPAHDGENKKGRPCGRPFHCLTATGSDWIVFRAKLRGAAPDAVEGPVHESLALRR